MRFADGQGERRALGDDRGADLQKTPQDGVDEPAGLLAHHVPGSLDRLVDESMVGLVVHHEGLVGADQQTCLQ